MQIGGNFGPILLDVPFNRQTFDPVAFTYRVFTSFPKSTGHSSCDATTNGFGQQRQVDTHTKNTFSHSYKPKQNIILLLRRLLF